MSSDFIENVNKNVHKGILNAGYLLYLLDIWIDVLYN